MRKNDLNQFNNEIVKNDKNQIKKRSNSGTSQTDPSDFSSIQLRNNLKINAALMDKKELILKTNQFETHSEIERIDINNTESIDISQII